MSEQLSLLDYIARGHAKAELAANHAGEEWKDAAYRAFVSFARSHQTFTTEDVRDLNRNLPEPPDRRAWGHVALRAQRESVVVSCGFAPVKSSNGSAKVLWRSLTCGVS